MDLLTLYRQRHFLEIAIDGISHKRHFPFKRVERKFKKIARTKIKRETAKSVNDLLQYA